MAFVAAMAMFPGPLRAQTADPLQSASCMAAADAERYLEVHDGFAYLEVRGERLTDRGQSVSVDDGATPMSFILAFHRIPKEDSYKTRWAVLLASPPGRGTASMVCPVVWGIDPRFDSVLALDAGFPNVDVLTSVREDPDEIRQECDVLRPVVEQALERTLVEFDGQAVPQPVATVLHEYLADALRSKVTGQMSSEIGRIADARERLEAEGLEAARSDGDFRCAGFSKMLAMSRHDGSRIIAHLSATHTDMLRTSYGTLTVLLSKEGSWQFLLTAPGGATIRYAEGTRAISRTTDDRLSLVPK
jgi:hypothetical protein